MEVRQLEVQIREAELEKNRLIHAYKAGELPKYPFSRVHALENQCFKLNLELDALRQRDPVKYDPKRPELHNPVELMRTKHDIIELVLAITWACGMVSVYLQERSALIAFFISSITLSIALLCNNLSQSMLDSVGQKLGDILPTYYCSDSLLPSGARQAIRHCLKDFGLGVYLTMAFSAVILIFDAVSLFRSDSFVISFFFSYLLAIGGFLATTVRLVIDVLRARYRARQIL